MSETGEAGETEAKAARDKAGFISRRRAFLMLFEAHFRADAEAATAAWKEHERRYPKHAYYYPACGMDRFPDPLSDALEREEYSRQLGLSPQEHEERERLLHITSHSSIYGLVHWRLDLPGHLDHVIPLLQDWLRRYPRDEAVRDKLRYDCWERCMADALWHDPLKQIGPDDGRSPQDRYRPWRASDPHAEKSDGLPREYEECLQSIWADRYEEVLATGETATPARNLVFQDRLKDAEQYVYLERATYVKSGGVLFFARMKDGHCLQFVCTYKDERGPEEGGEKEAEATIRHQETPIPGKVFDELIGMVPQFGVMTVPDQFPPLSKALFRDLIVLRLGPGPDETHYFAMPGGVHADPNANTFRTLLLGTQGGRILQEDCSPSDWDVFGS